MTSSVIGAESGALERPRRSMQISSSVLRRVRRREGVQMLGVAVLTLLVTGYFAPRGFRGGFTDMAHDGYQLREVLDLDRGGTIFKDTFDQYGPLAGYLNVAGYRMFGRNLLAVKYAMCLWYAATAVLLYLLARHLLTPALSVVSVVAWLALAPFYRHGVMISPHAYVLFFQALATLAVVRFSQRDRLAWLAVAGLCCGLCWALKTSMGILFALGVSAYLALRFLDRRSKASRTMAALTTFLGAAACVVASALAVLAFKGALHDWYLQTVVFPKAFYVDQIGAGVGAFASLTKFAWHFLELNFDMTNVPVALYWHAIRVVVIAGAIYLSRRRAAPEALLLSACLTPVLWLGAYPSANYMHQWWMASLSIAPFVYCIHGAIHRANRRFALARVTYPESVLTVAVLVLILSPGLMERLQSAREKRRTLTETFDTPRAISGIRTDKETLKAFQLLYGAIRNYKHNHPSARIVSRDHCDGYTNCVPESLLWLSFLDDNTHDHPIYWPIPVLTTSIYPDYDARFQNDLEQTRPLVVDSWNGPFRPDNTLSGYTLLVGVRMEFGYWYLFAPEHRSALEHGEVQVRLEPQPPAGVVANTADKRTDSSSDAGSVELDGAARDDVLLGIDGQGAPPRRLYTWPADIDVPPPPPSVDAVNAETAGRAKIVVVDRGRWVVRGSVESRFSYLLYFKERTVDPGEYFFATGYVHEGGLQIGLQRDEKWAGSVTVRAPGPFAVVLKPTAGRYNLVVANAVTPTTWRDVVRQHGAVGIWWLLTGESLRNSFEIDRAGWTFPSAQRTVR